MTIKALENSLQKTKSWIKDIGQILNRDDPHCYHALRAVLHALRDRLTVTEANDLASQLPLVLRGIYFENWRPECTPLHERSKEQFLQHIVDAFPRDSSVDPEETVRAVFRVIASRVSEGEINDVKGNLPSGVSDLWPES
jgi:uncharacterized protein (DUF2267 family)